MKTKNTATREGAGNSALISVQPKGDTTLRNEANAIDQKRENTLMRLTALYLESVKTGAALLKTSIDIGSSVTEVITSFALPDGKRVNPKLEWKNLEKTNRVPFGWVQALRYRKIFERRDELNKKMETIGTNLVSKITVEKAYRLLGGTDVKIKNVTPSAMPADLTASIFGVNSQQLIKRQRELAEEIKTSQEEADRASAKVSDLRQLETDYGYVLNIVNKPNVLETPPRPSKRLLHPFGRVGKDDKTVAGFFNLLTANYQCYEKKSSGSVFAGKDKQQYRNWVNQTFVDKPEIALKKIQDFCFNPDKAIAADPDYTKFLVIHKKELEKLNQEESERQIARDKAVKEAKKAAREDYDKKNPKKKARLVPQA